MVMVGDSGGIDGSETVVQIVVMVWVNGDAYMIVGKVVVMD